jgi:GT2 family glycosyltransferase
MINVFVGIPTLNGPNRLEDCLNAIFKTHDLAKYAVNIVVVDDGSTKENLDENIKICNRRGIELLIQNKRLGVATGWNTLVNHDLNSEYCILLNDDILVVDNWIDVVVFTLKHNNIIGVVGLNAYEGEYSKLPSNNIPTYVESQILLGGNLMPLLSARGYAFGFRKNDYRSINGFDQQFFCFFEEIDFNLNMMKILGKRNCILSYPILKHLHGATTFSQLPDHSQIFTESKQKFEEKWQIKWEDLRKLFNKDTINFINKNLLNEWNSNIDIWG